MSQWITPRRNQSNPSAVTPDTTRNAPVEDSINNNNLFNTLVTTDSDSDSLNQADDDSDSISTMGTSDDNSCLISQEALKNKMETLEPGVTATNNNPSYTDIVLFQEAMGNAVAGLGVANQTFGFSYLVDTTERFQKRHSNRTRPKPMDMPTPPVPLSREERADRTARRLYTEDLKEYREASHMKTIGLALLTKTFPNCLDLKETSLGYPPDFHLKDALAYVLDNTTSRLEQDKEFQGFQRDLLNLQYKHEPRSNSIDKFFKSIQKLKRKQDLVAPYPGTGLTYIQLISNAQTQVYEGIGGRTDLVHELKNTWNTQQGDLIASNTTHDQIWEQFKAYYKKELHKLDLQGFTTNKTTNSARSTTTPTQESYNLELAHRISGIESQMDALHDHQVHVNTAMSVIGNNQRAFNAASIPNYIQTDTMTGNTSAIGSDTITEAQCKRLLNEQQITMGKQMDAMALKNQELLDKIRRLELSNSTVATATTNTSSSGMAHSQSHNQNHRNMVKDTQGRKWYQVKFYCSKHGFNTSHSNDNCNNKHADKGHPWIPGATASNTKGGSTALADKFNHWFERSSKQYSPQPPT